MSTTVSQPDLGPVDERHELLGGEHAVALGEQLGDLVPVGAVVEHHPDDVATPAGVEERVARRCGASPAPRPATRNVTSVVGPARPRPPGCGRESVSASTVRTWAKVLLRTIQRTPVHASSSYASGSAMQIGRAAPRPPPAPRPRTRAPPERTEPNPDIACQRCDLTRSAESSDRARTLGRVRRRLRIGGRVQGGVVPILGRAGDGATRRGWGSPADEPDGSVTVEAEGTSAAVAAMEAWCRIGPPRARGHEHRGRDVAEPSTAPRSAPLTALLWLVGSSAARTRSAAARRRCSTSAGSCRWRC